MPEYMQYVSNRDNQLDWGGITGRLISDIRGIEESRAAKRAEDEVLYQRNQKALNEPALNKSQSLNEFYLNGAFQGKDQIYQWNQQLKKGQIDRRTYQLKMNNLNDDWNNLSVITKSMDQRLQQAMERQQVGPNGELPPGSAIEAEMNGYFGSMANLKGKGIAIGDDGRVVLATYDDEGNVVNSSDIRYINNPMNIAFNRTDLSGLVKADVTNWGGWKIGRITDVRQNPQFKKSKVRLIETLTSSPRSAASILVDNSGEDYTVYFGKDDYNAKFSDIKRLNEEAGVKLTDAQINDMMISMKQDENGDYQPDLTPSQVAKAKEIVGNEIETQLGREVEPRPMMNGGGSTDKDDERYNGNYYEDLRTAWDLSSTSPQESVNRLNNLAGGKVQFKWVQGGLQAYKPTTSKVKKIVGTDVVEYNSQELVPIGGPVNTLDAVQKYFYTEPYKFDKDKQAYLGRNQRVSTKSQEPAKKSIKASDIKSKAKAAGYSESEYRALLKKNGVKII